MSDDFGISKRYDAKIGGEQPPKQVDQEGVAQTGLKPTSPKNARETARQKLPGRSLEAVGNDGPR